MTKVNLILNFREQNCPKGCTIIDGLEGSDPCSHPDSSLLTIDQVEDIQTTGRAFLVNSIKST